MNNIAKCGGKKRILDKESKKCSISMFSFHWEGTNDPWMRKIGKMVASSRSFIHREMLQWQNAHDSKGFSRVANFYLISLENEFRNY